MLDPQTECLDSQGRYQILDDTIRSSASLFHLQVHDRQPLTLPDSPIEIALAQPYLNLQTQFCQVVPMAVDAWESHDRSVLILETRSHLPLLADYLRTHKAIPLPQILHWFYKMVDLWEALAPLDRCQSLLEMQNLRLDEDQILCLEQLFVDQTGDQTNVPTLKNLGTIWQMLLAQMGQTQSAVLHQLLAEIQSEAITTPDTLRSRLKAIAHEIPADSFDPEAMSDLPSPDSNPVPATPNPTAEEIAATQAVTLIPEEVEDEGDDPTIVLPMQLFSLDDAGQTDIGRQRTHNEDCYGINTRIQKTQLPSGRVMHARGLYVLCDGMGGHASGEVASQLAVETLQSYFQQYWQEVDEQKQPTKLPPADQIRAAVQLANSVIYNQNQEGARSGSGRMGTTLVTVLIQDTEAVVAHVGDSRLYRYTRRQGLEQVTVDHEVGQREILRGVEPEIAYGRPDSYQLTQALGPRDEYFVNPDVQFFELNEDMLLILASDGLTDNSLLENHWQSHVDPLLSSRANLDQGVSKLIDLANEYNGHDNITAIAIRVKVRPNLDRLR
jgi:protein phosphatase